jgi:hypothetical protein
VEGPSKNAHADLVIESLEGDVVVIAETTLPSDDSKTLDGDVEANERSGTPPDRRVTYKVYLSTKQSERNVSESTEKGGRYS